MDAQRLPIAQFRSLAPRELLTVVVGWVVLTLLLFLGFADAIDSSIGGLVLAVVVTTALAITWVRMVGRAS